MIRPGLAKAKKRKIALALSEPKSPLSLRKIFKMAAIRTVFQVTEEYTTTGETKYGLHFYHPALVQTMRFSGMSMKSLFQSYKEELRRQIILILEKYLDDLDKLFSALEKAKIITNNKRENLISQVEGRINSFKRIGLAENAIRKWIHDNLGILNAQCQFQKGKLYNTQYERLDLLEFIELNSFKELAEEGVAA